LRAVLAEPGAEQLTDFIHCFTAGFARGIKDTRKFVPLRIWVDLVSDTSMRLARDHSAAKAGCWLAGIINGRIGAAENPGEYSSKQVFNDQVREAFFAAWNSGHILECAEQTAVPFLRRHVGPAAMSLELNDVVLLGQSQKLVAEPGGPASE